MGQNVYDYVVVGAGVMGRCTAFYLSSMYPDAKCALIDQFKFGEGEGGSHSRIRIIRSTYFSSFYKDLCLEGLKNWQSMQKLLNAKLIVENPFLAYIEDEQHFKRFETASKGENHIEKLSMQQVRQKFPSAPNVNIKNPAFYDKNAGIIMAANFMKLILGFLRNQKNLDLLQETQVLNIDNNSKEVALKLKTKNQEKIIFAKKVSLSCGRWIGQLIPSVNRLIKATTQTTTYWKMKEPERYQLGNAPSWVQFHTNQGFYYLPDTQGDGVKYGFHNEDPQLEKKFKTEKEYGNFMVEKLKTQMDIHFKDKYEAMTKVEKCYYTMIKSQDFLIDWTDQYENVLICSPCSGHGFKFAPIIGQIVADLLKKDESIELFEKNRYLMRLYYHLGINLE